MNKLTLPTLLLLLAVPASAQVHRPALLVLNKQAGELAVVDGNTLQVVGRARTGEGPHEVTVTSDGRYAVVANYGAQTPGSSLSLIELATLKETKLDLGALRRPHGIAAGGDKIWFTVEANKAVARLDPATGAIDGLIGTGQDLTHMLVLTRDQSRIYTANISSGSVTVIERTAERGYAGWRVRNIAVGKGPEGFDLSPDEKELWVANSGDGAISVIDTAALSVRKTIPGVTKRSNRLKFTPDGKRVLVSDIEAEELVVLDAAAQKVERRIKLEGTPVGVLITPDGSRAFIARQQAGVISVLDLKTLTVTGEIKPGDGPDGMAWLP